MKKLLKTTVVAFIVYKIIDYIIHGFVLGNDYMELADVYRPDMADYMWIYFVGPFIVILLLAKLYTTIWDKKRCMFAPLMTLIMMIPAAFYSYAMIDISLLFTFKWFVLGLIQIFLTIKVIEKMLGKCKCRKCAIKKDPRPEME